MAEEIGCGKGLGTHWGDDGMGGAFSMAVKCGGSMIHGSWQYCSECLEKLPGCKEVIPEACGKDERVECGVPNGFDKETVFCKNCKSE